MSKTIVIVGFGPGISTAVARKFGAEGFSVVPNMRNTKEGAILITNGAFGEMTPQMDEYAVSIASLSVDNLASSTLTQQRLGLKRDWRRFCHESGCRCA